MAKIWFRVGMEAEVSREEMEILLAYSGQIEGERDCRKAHAVMESIIKKSELSGETYILGKKDCCSVDDYDNPDNEINFLF